MLHMKESVNHCWCLWLIIRCRLCMTKSLSKLQIGADYIRYRTSLKSFFPCKLHSSNVFWKITICLIRLGRERKEILLQEEWRIHLLGCILFSVSTCQIHQGICLHSSNMTVVHTNLNLTWFFSLYRICMNQLILIPSVGSEGERRQTNRRKPLTRAM